MSGSPHLNRRTSRALRSTRAARTARATAAVLGVAGLAVLGVAPVAVAEDGGAELVVGGVESVDGAKPGSTLDLSPTVSNKGTKAADRVVVSYSVTRGLDYTSVPSNCLTYQVVSYDEAPARWDAYCEFDQTVQPGAVYALGKPFAVKVLERAFHDNLGVSVGEYGGPEGEDGATTPPVRGTAPAVRLVEKPDGTAGTEDVALTTVTTDNTADFKVTGARLKGDVGDTVPVKVSFTNAGPAWVRDTDDTPVKVVRIKPPAGTSVVAPHGFCEAEDGVYACGKANGWMDDGEHEDYSFKLKINKKVPGAKGSVTLTDWARPFDPDKTNDKADIVLNGTDGGSDADATTGGTSPNGPAGDELADTGSSSATLSLAGAAVAATAVGAGIVVLVRRRTQENRG